jgi:hypothetical protein
MKVRTMRGAAGARPRRRGGAAVVLLAGAALAGAGAQPAVAAPTWLPPADLSGGAASAAGLGVSARGEATAVWRRSDGSNQVVQSSTRPVGGAWGAPVTLSASGQDAGPPTVAVEPGGDALAAWSRFDGADDRVQVAERASGGGWGAPVTVSSAGVDATGGTARLGSGGDAAVGWLQGGDLVVAVRPSGGGWGTPVTVSTAGTPITHGSDLTVDGAGNVTAVWIGEDAAGNDVVHGATRPAGGAWSRPVAISPARTDTMDVRAAVGANGDVVAIWQALVPSGYSRPWDWTRAVYTADLPSGGSWSAPVQVARPGFQSVAYRPDVAIGPDGDAAATWWEQGASTGMVLAATRPAGGAWSAPTWLDNGVDPRVAIGGDGAVMVAWALTGLAGGVSASTLAPGGSWSSPATVSADGVAPQLAADGQGNVTTLWRGPSGASTDVVRAAGYDAAGPLLDGLTVPATATAGTPVAVSVRPLDVWSPPVTTDWAFGDGGTATGDSASHVYTAPGSYDVVVTSTDAIGNTTVERRTVVVS